MGSPELRAAPAQRAAAKEHTRAPTRPGAPGLGRGSHLRCPAREQRQHHTGMESAGPPGVLHRCSAAREVRPRTAASAPPGRRRGRRNGEGRGRALRRRRAAPPTRTRPPIGGAAAEGGPTEGDALGRGAAVWVRVGPVLAPGPGAGAGSPRPEGFSLRLQPARVPPRVPT